MGVTTQLQTDLNEIATDLVRRAMEGGAAAAEAVVHDGTEFSTVVRLHEVESLKESGSKAAGVRVFFGRHAASTHTSDFSREGLEQLVRRGMTWVLVRQRTELDEIVGVGCVLNRWRRAACFR